MAYGEANDARDITRERDQQLREREREMNKMNTMRINTSSDPINQKIADGGCRELTPQEWLMRRVDRLREEANTLEELAQHLPPRMSWAATVAMRNLIINSTNHPIR